MPRVSRFEWERGLRAVPIPLAQRGVLWALATYMDTDGSGARPEQATLAEDCGVDERTIKRWLSAAVAAGLLERVGSSHVGHVAPYLAVLPDNVLAASSALQERRAAARRGQSPRGEGGTPVPLSSPPRRAKGDSAVPLSNPEDRRGGQAWQQRGTGLAAEGDGAVPPTTQDHPETTTTAREEDPVIVVPEDREPDSPAALADRLRSYGVDWSDHDVALVRRRLVQLLGDDARAEGLSTCVLDVLAQRPVRHRIRSLGAWSLSLGDQALLELREVVEAVGQAAKRRPSPRRLADQAALEQAARRSEQLDQDELGAKARQQATRDLPPGATTLQIDKEALWLLSDTQWRGEQLVNALQAAP